MHAAGPCQGMMHCPALPKRFSAAFKPAVGSCACLLIRSQTPAVITLCCTARRQGEGLEGGASQLAAEHAMRLSALMCRRNKGRGTKALKRVATLEKGVSSSEGD